MSKVTRKEWYTRVNALWPEDVPALTGPEAIRAARKLHRFALGVTIPLAAVRLTSGNRFTWKRHGILSVNPERGWKKLVHHLSHLFDNRLHPETKPHASEHARLEMRMIKEVIKRGWLAGSLKDQPKALAPERDARAEKYARLYERVRKWEAKHKRAEVALKKLRRQCAYYERVTGVDLTTAVIH